MADPKQQQADRAERLAAELRANLKKRKAQARAKARSTVADGDDVRSSAVEKPQSSG